jgi:hypothetical protein
VVPTITTAGRACILLRMASGSDAVTGDGQPSPGSQSAETLSVAEIVMTILQARKTMPWATAASVSRERDRDQVHVRVTLLEGSSPSSDERPQKHGEVVATFTVRRLGEDLARAFGEKDVIILK